MCSVWLHQMNDLHNYGQSKMRLFTMKKIDILPHRCRWYEPQARIQVEESNNGWLLKGNPRILFQGNFETAFSRNERNNLLEFEQRKRPPKYLSGNRGIPAMNKPMRDRAATVLPG